MKLEEGMIVWTCDPSLESCYYYGDLIEPHQVKMAYNSNGALLGYSFDEETREIHDTSVTFYIHKGFETKKEANEYYEQYLAAGISYQTEKLEEFRKCRED